MGRVAKYKKVKASLKDGFRGGGFGGEYVWGSMNTQKPKRKSQTSERLRHKRDKKRRTANPEYEGGGSNGNGNDASIKDDFDLNDLVGSLKKQSRNQLDQLSGTMTHQSSVATKSTSKPNAIVTASQIQVGNQTLNVSIPKSDREERQMRNSLGKSTAKDTDSSSEKKTMQKRQEGESMNAFNRRLKEETAMALAEDYKKNKQSRAGNKKGNTNGQEDDGALSKSQRRKEFLNRKKRKKRMRNEPGIEFPDEEEEVMARRHQGDGDGDGFITGEAAVARLSFLDQVEQPPVFAQLPRGASKKPNGKLKCKEFESKSKLQKEESIRAEQNSMEAMRRKVQAQYAILKQKRRAQGASFHL